jgi:hypothetical protein
MSNPPSTSLPLTNRYPSFPTGTPREIQDAINRLYDIVWLQASQIEVLRQSVNSKAPL